MHSLKRSLFLLSAATAATASLSLACTPEQLLSLATGAGLQLLGISPTTYIPFCKEFIQVQSERLNVYN